MRRPLDPSRRRALLRAHGRNAKDASYRLLQTNQPFRHSTDRSILSFQRGGRGLTPRRSLRSSPFTPRSPLIDDQSGSRAPPPFASSLNTKDGIQRVSRPDSDREPLLMEIPFPSAEAAFVSAACSAAIAIGGDASGILVAWTSVAGCPRRGPRASNTSSKGLVATIPDAFARSSASCPSAAFATALFGARHFVVASLAREAREASLSAGDCVHPPSPEPRFDPRFSSTMRIGARISLRASCNRVFNP